MIIMGSLVILLLWLLFCFLYFWFCLFRFVCNFGVFGVFVCLFIFMLYLFCFVNFSKKHLHSSVGLLSVVFVDQVVYNCTDLHFISTKRLESYSAQHSLTSPWISWHGNLQLHFERLEVGKMRQFGF